MSDNSDADGTAIAFEWLGFTLEFAAGRRAAMWRNDPEALALVRAAGSGTVEEQQRRLRALEPAACARPPILFVVGSEARSNV